MGLLDNYTGIGMSPRPTIKHQLIAGKIYKGLDRDLTDIVLAWESVVDANNLNSQAPDLVIYTLDYLPEVIIEITTRKEAKAIREKVTKLLEDYPTIKEGFVYDYESCIWYVFGKDVDTECPSCSEYLDVDLDEYLED